METNARLEAAGVEVMRDLPGASSSSARGGPRALSCPVSRDSVAAPAAALTQAAAPALTLVAGEQAAVPGPASADVPSTHPRRLRSTSDPAALASETAALASETAALTPEAPRWPPGPVVPVASAEAQTATMAGLATH